MSAPVSINTLSPDAYAIVSADLRFFTRFPRRRHRLRLAGRGEVADAFARGLLARRAPPGFVMTCGVRLVAPGHVQTVIGIIDENYPTDVPEHMAAETFRFLARCDDALMVRAARAVTMRSLALLACPGGEEGEP